MSISKNMWLLLALTTLHISAAPTFAQQVVVGQSTPLQQQLGNFVAIPAGTVTTPTGQQQLEFRFNLPVVFNNPQVPTDFTGPGGSLGHAQGLRQRILGPDRNTLPDSKGLIAARDTRYRFTGRWSPLTTQQVAVVNPGTVIQTASAPRILTQAAVVPRVAASSETLSQAQIMPTAGASYSVSAANEITLGSGALLIKGGANPLYVLMPLTGNTAVVRVEEDSLAMISNMNGRVSVANLHDSHNDSVVMYLTDRARQTYGEMPVRIGYMVEAYANSLPAGEHRIAAHSVLNQLSLSNGYSVETTRLSYPRALKHFNITPVLSDNDLMRVVKTAAAVSYMDREREWNGLTPDAQ